MKKFFLMTAIVGVFAFSSARAQDPAMAGPKLGIGAEFAFPMGDFGDAYDLGYGGALQYQHPVATSLKFTASAGYMNFTGKNYESPLGDIKLKDFGVIPVKVGLKYFLAENVFVNGEVGATFGTEDNFGTRFTYAPGIGVEFPVADKSAIELGARYEGWSKKDDSSNFNSTPQFIGLRLAWNFGL